MGKIIGIDLGTTNSCVAVLEEENPVVIASREGSRTIPSIVAFTHGNEKIVGLLAKRQQQLNPTKTIFAVKRLMGRKFNSNETQKAKMMLPYELIPAANGDVHIKVEERTYSPIEISAMILAHVKDIAEEYLGGPIEGAVITVPAYFDDSQRQATKDAGRIAGINVLRIINEPTAASLAYGFGGSESKKIAVYDLGGGTFDISILSLSGGVFEVRSTSGNTFLGGEDFDQRITDWLVASFLDESSIDLRSDRVILQRIKEAAEKAKIILSREEQTEINIPFIAEDASGPKHLKKVLTRKKLEELTFDLIEMTKSPCFDAIKMAGLMPSDIDEVILVGGQTRMPKVVETVREIFGCEPNRSINPDEVVGIGAAIQAGILRGEVKEMTLLDVTPLSLGIEAKGGLFVKIIDRNTTIPVKKSRIFTTVSDNQTMVEVHVLQGEREIAAHNKSLGKFDLVGIPPCPKGVPQIEVTFDIDSNGIVNVSARDQSTGKQQKIVVKPSSGLFEAEIDRIVQEAKQYREEDRKRAELLKMRSKLEGLIESVTKTFWEFGDILGEEKRKKVDRYLQDARKSLASTDILIFSKQIQNMDEASQILSDVILYDPKSFGRKNP
ncbi:MAG: molecular chaperone DnaK [Acidobacteriota bacterium]